MALGRKKESKNTNASSRRPANDSSFRVGRTLAGDAHRALEEKRERAADLKKRKFKDTAIAIGVVLLVASFVAAVISLLIGVVQEYQTANAPSEPTEPTVKIYDENAGNNVSQRVKSFVVRLEDDAKDNGLKLERVILPYQMVREIDVYVEGRSEYYKMSIDRDSAVQAEDMARMILYLTEHEIAPSYVDLRVEGKAYYK